MTLARMSAVALIVMGLLPSAPAMPANESGQLAPGNAVHRGVPTTPPWRRPSVNDGVGLLASPAAMREEHLKTRVLTGLDRAGRTVGALRLESEHGLQLVDHRIAANLRPAANLRL